MTDNTAVRLDKWLWAARLFKTRSLAVDEITKGRVSVNDAAAKPARDVRIGDRITLRRSGLDTVLDVRGLSHLRGPAPVAQLLYVETPASIEARARAAEARRMGTEPALAIAQGRPTKRDRRQLGGWQRWSASVDDEPG
jgi:ribosome-associated heat shock protein Hsp15